MKNLKVYMLLMVGMMMVGCNGSDSAANVNVSEMNVTQEEKDHDFRNSNWGDSVEDVKKSEDLKLEIDEKNFLVYSGENIVNLSTGIVYYFSEDDKLSNAFYAISETHSNQNLYIEDYETLKISLSEKYGQPKSDDIKWNRDLYKDSPDDYGFAVSLGDLVYTSSWVNNDTLISLVLKGDNNDISLTLLYQDTNNKQETDLSGL